jgi:predicted AlkP superfamily pyrophosphatase or phosphodiesterase
LYDGRCVSNIPDTLSKILALRSDSPLRLNGIYSTTDKAANLVFVLLDGLGYEMIAKGIASHSLPSLEKLLTQAYFAPITTVFPSTTSTATTSIHYGLTPQEHGVVGYTMFFPQFGTIADTLHFVPLLGGRSSLFDAGLDPNTFLEGRTIHEKMTEHGFSSMLYFSKWITDSGLSKITNRGSTVISHLTAADMFTRLRKELERRKENSFHFAYFASPDTVAHTRGPFSDEYLAEVDSVFHSLISEVFHKLHSSVGNKTSIIISADHGLSYTEEQNVIDLAKYPDLLQLFEIPPCGDSRALFLRVRPGRLDKVREYIEKRFPAMFLVMDSKEVISKGLLGRGKVSDRAAEALGDLVAVPLGLKAVDNSNVFKRNGQQLGRHGGLSKNEMLVPLIAARLKSG